MGTRTNAKELWQALETAPQLSVARGQGGILGQLSSVLTALAAVESNYRLDAHVTTAAEASRGLWQINSKAWPHAVPDSLDTSLEAQIVYLAPVADEATKYVRYAAQLRMGKTKFAGTIGAKHGLPPTAEMQATWWNAVWQWGPDDLHGWINSSGDHTSEGFAGWLKAKGVSDREIGAYRSRHKRFMAVWESVRKYEPTVEMPPEPKGPIGDIVDKVTDALRDAKDDLEGGAKWYAALSTLGLIVVGIALLKMPGTAGRFLR